MRREDFRYFVIGWILLFCFRTIILLFNSGGEACVESEEKELFVPVQDV